MGGGVQRNRLPHDVQPVVSHAAVLEEAGGEVGSGNLEPLVGVGLLAQSGVVQRADQERQFGVVVLVGLPLLLCGQRAAEQEAAQAVVAEERLLGLGDQVIRLPGQLCDREGQVLRCRGAWPGVAGP